MPEVTYERRGAAGMLTIDRPERLNAVDPETADQLLEAYREFEGDDDARVLILTGAGEAAFCAGADLKSVAAAMDDEGIAQQWLKPRPHGPLGFTRITSPKPTIAAISGYALAGGLELALWCDLRIGTETAKLGFPERRWGVPLIDGGTQRLPRIVGSGRALDLVISGRVIDVEEAERFGLITEIAAEPLARARRDSSRMRSSSWRRPLPPCSTSTRPSVSPSRRTSRRSAASGGSVMSAA